MNAGTGGVGIGVYGSQAGSGWGVYGTAPSGVGVYGSESERPGGVLLGEHEHQREPERQRQPERDRNEELPNRRPARSEAQVPAACGGGVERGTQCLQWQRDHERERVGAGRPPGVLRQDQHRLPVPADGDRSVRAGDRREGDREQQVRDPHEQAERARLLAGDRAAQRRLHARAPVQRRAGQDRAQSRASTSRLPSTASRPRARSTHRPAARRANRPSRPASR